MSGASRGRHPGKRLSPWRVTTAIAVVAAVIAGAVAVPLLLNNDAEAATVEAGPRWFGGYFDVTAAKPSEVPTTDLEAPSNIVLSFIVAESEDSCVPSWGTYYGLDEAATGLDLDLDRRIARMRQDGAQIAVSFGGALNTDLAAACELEVQAFGGLFGSEDQRTGMKAFLEKTKATFVGK